MNFRFLCLPALTLLSLAACRGTTPGSSAPTEAGAERSPTAPVEVVVALEGAPSATVGLARIGRDGRPGAPTTAAATAAAPARFSATAGAWIVTADGGDSVLPWTSEPLQILPGSEPRRVTVRFAPAYEIRGRVNLRGTPASELAVGAMSDDPDWIETSVDCTVPLAPDGRFVLRRLPGSIHEVRLCSGDYLLDIEAGVAVGTRNLEALAVPEGTGSLEVAMTLGSAATARIATGGVTPIADVSVSEVPRQSTSGDASVPFHAGTTTLFTFRLPPGEYDAGVRARGRNADGSRAELWALFAHARATVKAGAKTRVVLAPEAAGVGAIRFRVTRGGAPLANATAQLFLPRQESPHFARVENTTGPTGEALFPAVSALPWDARAYVSGRFSPSFVVHPEAGTTKDLTLEVPTDDPPLSFVPAVCSRWDGDYLTVTEAAEGLLPGDRIVRTDGFPIRGMSWERYDLSGARGTAAFVDVERPGTGKTFSKKLFRTQPRDTDCQATSNHLRFISRG